MAVRCTVDNFTRVYHTYLHIETVYCLSNILVLVLSNKHEPHCQQPSTKPERRAAQNATRHPGSFASPKVASLCPGLPIFSKTPVSACLKKKERNFLKQPINKNLVKTAIFFFFITCKLPALESFPCILYQNLMHPSVPLSLAA